MKYIYIQEGALVAGALSIISMIGVGVLSKDEWPVNDHVD
jgi:hypothetical protein